MILQFIFYHTYILKEIMKEKKQYLYVLQNDFKESLENQSI